MSKLLAFVKVTSFVKVLGLCQSSRPISKLYALSKLKTNYRLMYKLQTCVKVIGQCQVQVFVDIKAYVRYMVCQSYKPMLSISFVKVKRLCQVVVLSKLNAHVRYRFCQS